MDESANFVNGLFSLKGRVGIVTGASRGIGSAIAEVLSKAGAAVYNFSRHPHTCDDQDCSRVSDLAVDLYDQQSMEKGVTALIEKEGHLDFLVNNAGISHKERAEMFSDTEYQKIAHINLEAAFKMCSLCYPYLKKSEFIGRIVSISSMGAYMGFSGVVPYCMTKSGITGLTRGLAEEWKNDNILVNSVAPGWFLTSLNQKMFEEHPDRKQAAQNRMMLNRFGEPKEIGYMVLFLLSEAATFITGQDIAVDGGATSHGY